MTTAALGAAAAGHIASGDPGDRKGETTVSADWVGFMGSFCIGVASDVERECGVLRKICTASAHAAAAAAENAQGHGDRAPHDPDKTEGDCGVAFKVEFRFPGWKDELPEHVLIVMDQKALLALRTASASIRGCLPSRRAQWQGVYVYQSWLFKSYRAWTRSPRRRSPRRRILRYSPR